MINSCIIWSSIIIISGVFKALEYFDG